MNISKVILITFSFILIHAFFAFFNDALLNSHYSLGTTKLFDFNVHLMINMLTGLFAGIFGGSLLVLVNSKLFRRKSFRFSILATTVGYVLIFITVTLISTIVYSSTDIANQLNPTEPLKQSIKLILNPVLFTYFILWGVITLFTLFLLQVNDKFGPGILLKFLRGQYYQPKMEERIFMFLDMRSSTTIAEKIGNEKYFNLLSDIISDITDTILNNKGEIYQYVGDEIVISWPLIEDVQNGNFLKCYFEIENKLINLGKKYEQKYGVIPELKAGIHYGQVMAGEIGVVKRDIIYSGDVLNTTARIQGSCNDYNVNILISKETFELIQNSEDYELIPIGSIELRGKERKIDLITINAI